VSASVKCGDVLTATIHGRVRVIEVLAIGSRRGPPSEAQSLYAERPAPNAGSP
jgi:ribosome-associated heat shock protein Hsp15